MHPPSPRFDWRCQPAPLTLLLASDLHCPLPPPLPLRCDNVDAQVYADLLKQTLQDAIASGLWEM